MLHDTPEAISHMHNNIITKNKTWNKMGFGRYAVKCFITANWNSRLPIHNCVKWILVIPLFFFHLKKMNIGDNFNNVLWMNKSH